MSIPLQNFLTKALTVMDARNHPDRNFPAWEDNYEAGIPPVAPHVPTTSLDSNRYNRGGYS